MSFKKPCRIHNATRTSIPVGFSGNEYRTNAALTEYKDRYELRVWIPHVDKRTFGACIKDGILIVYENFREAENDKQNVLACFLLPANAQQNKAEGLWRNYGLKIVIPIAVPEGKTIKVPIIGEPQKTVRFIPCKKK